MSVPDLSFIANYQDVRARLRGPAKPALVVMLRSPAPVPVPSNADTIGIYPFPIGPLPKIYTKLIGPPDLRHSLERARFIRHGIASAHGFTVDELISSQRKAPLVRARHEAIYIVSKCTLWSLPQIGRFFGGRDHSTVISSIRKHQERIDAGTVGP